MTYTPNRTEAMECDEMSEKWKRAGVALTKWGEAMAALFERIRESTVTQKRFYEATKDFYK